MIKPKLLFVHIGWTGMISDSRVISAKVMFLKFDKLSKFVDSRVFFNYIECQFLLHNLAQISCYQLVIKEKYRTRNIVKKRQIDEKFKKLLVG